MAGRHTIREGHMPCLSWVVGQLQCDKRRTRMRNLATLALPLLACVALGACASSGGMYVSAGASLDVAPPDLPVYDQPPCPGDGYLWTPGYWAWGNSDYYWVPGTWV